MFTQQTMIRKMFGGLKVSLKNGQYPQKMLQKVLFVGVEGI